MSCLLYRYFGVEALHHQIYVRVKWHLFQAALCSMGITRSSPTTLRLVAVLVVYDLGHVGGAARSGSGENLVRLQMLLFLLGFWAKVRLV
jgi:hypothetical protein